MLDPCIVGVLGNFHGLSTLACASCIAETHISLFSLDVCNTSTTRLNTVTATNEVTLLGSERWLLSCSVRPPPPGVFANVGHRMCTFRRITKASSPSVVEDPWLQLVRWVGGSACLWLCALRQVRALERGGCSSQTSALPLCPPPPMCCLGCKDWLRLGMHVTSTLFVSWGGEVWGEGEGLGAQQYDNDSSVWQKKSP